MKSMLARLCCAAALAGCGDDGPELSDAERSLVADGLASLDHDGAFADTFELSFSPTVAFVPTDDVFDGVHEAAELAIVAFRARVTPTSCATSVKSDLVVASPSFPMISHELDGCTAAGRTIAGSVTSRWSVADSGIRNSHETSELAIAEIPVTAALTVSVFPGAIEIRQRTLTLATADAAGEAVVIEGRWSVGHEVETGCGTRIGLVTATLGARTFDRDDLELTWCGVESAATMTGGKLELRRDGLRTRVTFLGDGRLSIESGNGTIATDLDAFAN